VTKKLRRHVDKAEKRSIISLLTSSSKDEEGIEVGGVASGKMWTYKTCWGVAATRKEMDGRKVITLHSVMKDTCLLDMKNPYSHK
jgi:hypothetical protein